MTAISLQLTSSLALAVFASPALAQWTVGPAGSGTTHQQIHSALAAASTGDTILVSPGTYEAFVVTKGISIVGSDADTSVIEIPSGSLASAIDVDQIPSSQTVRISGLSLSTGTTSPDARIELTQCLGRVELVNIHSLQTLGFAGSSDEPTLRIADCAAVFLDDCILHGSHPPFISYWQDASSALSAINSNVWVNNSDLRGGNGGEGAGAPAVSAISNSFVSLSSSDLMGGFGGAHFGFEWWDIYGFDGSEAVYAQNSEVQLSGGPGNIIRGGEGAQLSDVDWTGGGPAVRLADNGTLIYASDVLLIEGANGDGTTSGQTIVEAGTGTSVIAELQPRPTLNLQPAGIHIAAPIEVNSSGTPSAVHFVFAALKGSGPLDLGSGQFAHIAAAQALSFMVTTLDGAGAAQTTATMPANPALTGLGITFQSLEANSTVLSLSNPALVTILN